MNAAIHNGSGERLAYAWTPGTVDDCVVVIGHGLTSQHDRPWLVAVSEALRSLEIPSLRFAFAGHGESEGEFSRATITKEVDDLGCVLDAIGDRRIAYVGHSMGAAIGMLRAARDPRIGALVSLAGMVHVAAFMEHHFGAQTPDRDVMLGKAHCPLTSHFLDDAKSYGSLTEVAPRVRVPWLLVHGSADDIVPLQDSLDVCAANPVAECLEMPGIDHRFTGQQTEMGALVAAWIDRWRSHG